MCEHQARDQFTFLYSFRAIMTLNHCFVVSVLSTFVLIVNQTDCCSNICHHDVPLSPWIPLVQQQQKRQRCDKFFATFTAAPEAVIISLKTFCNCVLLFVLFRLWMFAHKRGNASPLKKTSDPSVYVTIQVPFPAPHRTLQPLASFHARHLTYLPSRTHMSLALP